MSEGLAMICLGVLMIAQGIMLILMKKCLKITREIYSIEVASAPISSRFVDEIITHESLNKGK